jgi:hypothetical protein
MRGMKIIVNNKKFETNPTGLNTNCIFEGIVYTTNDRKECVYGINEQQVIELARSLKQLDSSFAVVHIYSPYDFLCIKREQVGTYFL